MSTNLKSWKDLEQTVARLLSAAGFNVEHNVQINHQQVDVFVERKELGEVKRIAVECKFVAHPLTKDEVANIYMKFDTLYEANLIDQILLITINGLTAQAKDMVARKRNLNHLRFVELQSSIIDFSSYTNFLIESFNEDGLSKCYVPLRAKRNDTHSDAFDLFDYVNEWLAKPMAKPIAILSSYGTGKTTFARHLAATLSKLWWGIKARVYQSLLTSDVFRMSNR